MSLIMPYRLAANESLISDIDSTNSINELTGVLRVYPNPNKGEFKFILPNVTGKLTVIDSKGIEVFSKEIFSSEDVNPIKVSDRGLYLIKFITESNRYIEKLIVE